jgi:hypothetical protein
LQLRLFRGEKGRRDDSVFRPREKRSRNFLNENATPH